MASRFIWTTLLASGCTLVMAQNLFSPTEIRSIQNRWSKDCTFESGLPSDANRKGSHAVRLTAEGSEWLWSYYRARGLGKVNPESSPTSNDPTVQAWEKWIDAKIAFDRYQASLLVAERNWRDHEVVAPPAGEIPAASHPGPMPADLLALAGEAPAMAEAVQIREYRIGFPTGTELTYRDNIITRTKWAYYRFPEGVQSAGQQVKKMPAAELQRLFSLAGLANSVQRVMAAVSLLEGGFDSVNTYDTGFLSVGVIQFATLRGGGGSLGRVMQRYKHDDPEAYQRNFRDYGIDVNRSGLLVAVRLESGEELVGPEAVREIIADKRLVAVFQHAGQRCDQFKVAQIRIAHDEYYPAEDTLTVRTSNGELRLKVKDFIRSEAGLATLMDRKVNTGKTDPLLAVVQRLADQRDIKTASELAALEAEIIRQMKYRKDYLSDIALSQPRDGASESYRGAPTKRDRRR